MAYIVQLTPVEITHYLPSKSRSTSETNRTMTMTERHLNLSTIAHEPSYTVGYLSTSSFNDKFADYLLLQSNISRSFVVVVSSRLIYWSGVKYFSRCISLL